MLAKLFVNLALCCLPSTQQGLSKVIIVAKNCNGKKVSMVETANQDKTIAFMNSIGNVFGLEIEAKKVGRSG